MKRDKENGMNWWQRNTEPLRRRIINFLGFHLTKPLRSYEVRIPNDMAALKANLVPGDIVLVEGDQRISQVIRYLTQSSWSHAAMYIGDELRRFQPEAAARYDEEFGSESRHLVIEALENGVVCSPISKYSRYNIRVCRPRGLQKEHLEQIVREVSGQLGIPYNMRHILDLGRYLFPVSLIPRRYRRAALRYGGELTEVICTTMLARAFGRVGYPIVPRVTLNEMTAELPTGWLARLRRPRTAGYRALYEKENPAMITPRDFDLSPYFDIVKFNHATATSFDYRRIEWAEGAPVVTPAPTETTEPETQVAA